MAAQLIYPKLQSISARHVIHNFNNYKGLPVNIDYGTKRNAVEFVSGDLSYRRDFEYVMKFNIDIIVATKGHNLDEVIDKSRYINIKTEKKVMTYYVRNLYNFN